jgi:predicted nucleotidyltransferase
MQSLVECLNRAERRGELRYLLIGGRSLEGHGYVRSTKDVDFLIATGDIPVMDRLLTEIGYTKVVETSIFSRWQHSSLGAEDVDLMFVNSATFEKLAEGSVPFALGSAEIKIPSVSNLVALKLHAIKNNGDRFAKDALDIITLMRLNPDALSGDGLKTLCDRFGTPDIWSKLQLLLS